MIKNRTAKRGSFIIQDCRRSMNFALNQLENCGFLEIFRRNEKQSNAALSEIVNVIRRFNLSRRKILTA